MAVVRGRPRARTTQEQRVSGSQRLLAQIHSAAVRAVRQHAVAGSDAVWQRLSVHPTRTLASGFRRGRFPPPGPRKDLAAQRETRLAAVVKNFGTNDLSEFAERVATLRAFLPPPVAQGAFVA